jgi:hypothetical protein
MFAVVATCTESLISSACFTASTYAFVAASCACVGSVTFEILELFTSTTPDPFGLSEILPFVFVEVISLPSNVKKSTSKEVSPFISVLLPPKDIESLPIVIELFESLLFAIEPAK